MNRVVKGKVASEIQQASTDLATKKLALADAVLLVERARGEAIKAEQTLVKLTHKAAKSVGIDPNDPSKGRWMFDPSTLTFTEQTDA